jgi:uncharacterized protein (DUF302 family)
MRERVRSTIMLNKPNLRRALVAFAVAGSAIAAGGAARADGPPAIGTDGVIRVKSHYGMEETIARIRADVAAKGIMFFSAVDQQKLAADAGIKLNPSTLLTFGNPPLGAQFLTANPLSGLDWPVRLLVLQDDKGTVWAAYTDFAWIARRHGITNRTEQFAKATSVVESITSTVRSR